MSDNAFVYWLLAHLGLILIGLWVGLISLIVWWDGRGRYKAMTREIDKWRRGQ